MDHPPSKPVTAYPAKRLRMRLSSSGIHFFDRVSGTNLLLDEVIPPASCWAKAPRQVSIALTNACDLSCPHCFAPKTNATLSFDQVVTWLSEEAERLYFGTEREYEAAGILHKEADEDTAGGGQYRIDAIDRPTFSDPKIRLLAIYSQTAVILDRARKRWNRAMEQPSAEDHRTPTLLVVDEARNLIPRDAYTQARVAVRELFGTIAAEGRNYGLFLVLVSQRPDKLDPLVLSECQNRVLMRLGSRGVLEATRATLGLEDLPPKTLESSLDLGKSRVLLVGPWSGGQSKFFYTAARRTTEGGRGLRPEHRATSRFAPAPPSASTPRAKSVVPIALPSKPPTTATSKS